MAYVAGAMAILGTVMGTGAQLASNKANAQMAEQEAQNAEQVGAFNERQFRRSAALQAGEGRAQAAASGVRADVGSPLLLELDFAKQAELQALDIRRGATMQAASSRYGAKLLNRSNLFVGIGGAAQGTSILSSLYSRNSRDDSSKMRFTERTTPRKPYISR